MKRELEKQRNDLKQLTSQYSTRDIYNADELALFYMMLPNRTLADSSSEERGLKNSKERITVMVCCNVDGSDKQRLYVINKSRNPHCFSSVRFNPNSIVQYYFNKKAWMTRDIFNDWIIKFNNRIRLNENNRKVLLLVDNCSGHLIEKRHFSNVRKELLPPNTTSELQPCDAGIIASLKSHYRRQLIDSLVSALDNYREFKTPNLKDALNMLVLAWKRVN